MSICAERDNEEWDNSPAEGRNESAVAKPDACVTFEVSSIKRVQAFGWLKQQALLRERQLNPKGTPVKQQLFRSVHQINHRPVCLTTSTIASTYASCMDSQQLLR